MARLGAQAERSQSVKLSNLLRSCQRPCVSQPLACFPSSSQASMVLAFLSAALYRAGIASALSAPNRC